MHELSTFIIINFEPIVKLDLLVSNSLCIFTLEISLIMSVILVKKKQQASLPPLVLAPGVGVTYGLFSTWNTYNKTK